MTTLTLQIDSPSILENLKQVLGTFKGVRIVTSQTEAADIPNATTLAAIAEAKEGRRKPEEVYDNVEDLMKSLLEA